MTRRLHPGWLVPGLGLALALGGAGAPASAQEVRDSLQDVIRERLERLTRRLGDTTGLTPDTTTDDNNLDMVSTSDSTLLELLALPGYDLVQYRGQAANFETRSRVLTLYGNEGTEAVMTREGLELAADSALVFDEKTGRLVTLGDTARYRPEQGDEVLTRRIIFDLNEDRGTASDVNTTMDAGLGEWIVRGDFPWVNADMSFGHDVMFTSCDHEEPHYHFVAREIKMSDGGTLVARNVLLYFADVGVLWLPFIAQSTEQGRRSGLLPIRFSVNDIVRTSGSYARRLSNVGFYWAINDYVDAQLGVDWWSGNYTAVTGQTQFRWLRQFMDSDINFRQFWRVEGGTETAFDAGYNWEISERSKLRLSGRYASSAAFVRQNSFDPREVTQSIDSEGGFNRRFDFGTLSLSANRRQFLSDDRVEMTLPTANFSLSTITLMPAPFNRARFYNNATLSASARASRSIRDQPARMMMSEEPFSLSMADSENLRGGLSLNLSAGNFSVSQSFDYNRDINRGLPADFFDPKEMPMRRAGVGSVGDLQRSVLFAPGVLEDIDFAKNNLTWSTSFNYQQTLVGSTTITPQLAISGRAISSDTSTVAGGGFVSAPNRISFGAQLKSDVYGFYLGGRLRHKVTPSFDFAWSPEVTPNAVQQATFGSQAVQPKRELVFGLNQTWEMRVDDEEADSAAAQAAASDPSGGPRRLPQSEKVTVLALRTSAVTYDFEQASQLGHFTRGFRDNLSLSHQISSDYLRGLTVSLEHLVFDDTGGGPAGGARAFSPYISNVNLGFSMGSQTAVFRWLRSLAGGESEADTAQSAAQTRDENQEDASDPAGFENEDLGESTVVPVGGRRTQPRRQQGEVGKWDANISYSLARMRGVEGGDNQMIQGTLNFQPTEKWSVRWRTSYDVVTGAFNDHMISLQRQMHRWEADFSFRQTATGNWTFLFEVALSDNRDLHFDYEQRTGGGELPG